MKVCIYILAGFALTLVACRSKIISSSAAQYTLKADTVGIDSAVYKLIQPYKITVDSAMAKVLCNAAIDMPAPDRKNIAPETLLGNFLTDVFLQTARANYTKPIDFVLMNTGGIRTSLPKGPITTRNIFEILPFDNRLTVVTISGDSAQALFNYVAKKGGDPVAGLRMGIKDKKPVDVLINGQPFDRNRSYTVLTNDFCAMGGDYMWFFTGAQNYTDLNIILRDAVISTITQYGKTGVEINAALDNRIYIQN
jgi:2',3'-cyclic-nucleotide 2'-phosphodiesterase (5'-nucleotidase family)